MRCLDLRVIKFEPNFYLRYRYQCGWAWPKIGGKIELGIYVKYEIPKRTYHDRMHIKVRAEKIYPNHWYIGETDCHIIEDNNPSAKPIVKEKIIKTILSYYDISGAFKGEDYRDSGWRKWRFEFFTDSGGPVKTIKVSAYWHAQPDCRFTDYKVEGVEQPPYIPQPKFTIKEIKVDKTEIYEGETVTVTATIQNISNVNGICLAKLFIDKYLITGEQLEIPAGASKTVKFKVEDIPVGKHSVCVDIGTEKKCVEITVKEKEKEEKSKLAIVASMLAIPFLALLISKNKNRRLIK